ncbi:chemotaxis protein CheW [Desulfonema limicola]|nr:chemotaxis protein CheW [Desulfonema limicola]
MQKCYLFRGLDDQEIIRLGDTLLPIVRLSEVLKKKYAFTRKTRAETAAGYKSEKKSQSLNLAVLRTGLRQFGLVYDQIIGFEEIVVKPLHPNIKSLGIYSGVTIMSNGRAALILNPEGIAVHAGTQSFNNPARTLNQSVKKEKSLDILIFKSGIQERFALELHQIKRIEKIRLSDIEFIKNREFISINETTASIMRLDKVLNVSPCTEKNEMFLIIPKNIKQESGILISEIIDTVQFKEKINIETFIEPGLQGTGIIRNHMTLFLDIYGLFKKWQKSITLD